jgi:hypothetical protein
MDRLDRIGFALNGEMRISELPMISNAQTKEAIYHSHSERFSSRGNAAARDRTFRIITRFQPAWSAVLLINKLKVSSDFRKYHS